MVSIASVTVKPEKRPAILNGKRCFAYTAMQSFHGGFVVEFEDGTLGEAVQGIDKFRFLDSKEAFEAYWWEGDSSITPEQAVAATLGSEREKALEELVCDMWFWGYEGHMDNKSQDWQMKHIDGVLDRMKKLGIEVD